MSIIEGETVGRRDDRAEPYTPTQQRTEQVQGTTSEERASEHGRDGRLSGSCSVAGRDRRDARGHGDNGGYDDGVLDAGVAREGDAEQSSCPSVRRAILVSLRQRVVVKRHTGFSRAAREYPSPDFRATSAHAADVSDLFDEHGVPRTKRRKSPVFKIVVVMSDNQGVYPFDLYTRELDCVVDVGTSTGMSTDTSDGARKSELCDELCDELYQVLKNGFINTRKARRKYE